MTKGLIATLSILGVLGFFALGFVGSIFSFRGQAVAMENTIVAQYDQNRNNYDNMWKRFKEIAQVSDKYADDLKKIYDATMQGRYGADGSKAMFQWIQEQNPQLDSQVYTKLQTSIEAGRISFEADQKQLIDKKREYQNLLRSNRALFVNWILRFPKIDLSKYDIVTSEATDDAFNTKKADEVQVF